MPGELGAGERRIGGWRVGGHRGGGWAHSNHHSMQPSQNELQSDHILQPIVFDNLALSAVCSL